MFILKILAVLLAIIGILGCVIPGLPGPPISWVGMLVMFLVKGTGVGGDPISLTALLVMLAVTVVVTVLDYVIPAYATRAAGGHKSASLGATIGLFVGLFFSPVAMIALSLLGAFVAEFFYENKGVWASFKASIGAFVGFILSTFLKLAASGVMAWMIFAHLGAA